MIIALPLYRNEKRKLNFNLIKLIATQNNGNIGRMMFCSDLLPLQLTPKLCIFHRFFDLKKYCGEGPRCRIYYEK